MKLDYALLGAGVFFVACAVFSGAIVLALMGMHIISEGPPPAFMWVFILMGVVSIVLAFIVSVIRTFVLGKDM